MIKIWNLFLHRIAVITPKAIIVNRAQMVSKVMQHEEHQTTAKTSAEVFRFKHAQ